LYFAGLVRLNLSHNFHCCYHAERLSFFYLITHADKNIFFGGGSAIKGANHWRFYHIARNFFFSIPFVITFLSRIGWLLCSCCSLRLKIGRASCREREEVGVV